MTKAEKQIVRAYVTNRYYDQNGRNIRFMENKEVHVTVNELPGKRCTRMTIIAGLAIDLYNKAIDSNRTV